MRRTRTGSSNLVLHFFFIINVIEIKSYFLVSPSVLGLRLLTTVLVERYRVVAVICVDQR